MTVEDVVFADDDGAVFVPATRAGAVLDAALRIHDTERRQADDVATGRLLRDQLRLAEFVRRREADPSHTFRRHLREIGGAIEE